MRAYLVGGYVRDHLLGLEPKDRDWVVVGATPQDLLDLGFTQVGADFPVFLHPETGEEYALARTERKSGNGYHGFTVDFNPKVTMREDLSRRDLTINAMAMDPSTGEIFDPFNGRKDLKNKVLRHVSSAFADDPLRVVRLARFASRFPDFIIDKQTEDLCYQMVLHGDLEHLPPERFWAELRKVFNEKQIHHFFHFLYVIDATSCVSFFNTVFGFNDYSALSDSETLDHICRTTNNLQGLDPETKFRLFVGLTTVYDLPGIDTRSSTIRNNLRRFNIRENNNPDALYEILRLAQAWSEGNTFNDFVQAVKYKEIREKTLMPNHKMLSALQVGTSSIKAAQFPDVTGKALGEAIKDARIEIIGEILRN